MNKTIAHVKQHKVRMSILNSKLDKSLELEESINFVVIFVPVEGVVVVFVTLEGVAVVIVPLEGFVVLAVLAVALVLLLFLPEAETILLVNILFTALKPTYMLTPATPPKATDPILANGGIEVFATTLEVAAAFAPMDATNPAFPALTRDLEASVLLVSPSAIQINSLKLEVFSMYIKYSIIIIKKKDNL